MNTPHDWAVVANLMSEYCTLADARDARGLAALFAPDARLVVGGQVFAGSAAIERCLGERLHAERQTAHLWTTPRFESVGSDEVRCNAIQLTIERATGSENTSIRLSELRDRFGRDASGRWRIRERVIERRMSW